MALGIKLAHSYLQVAGLVLLSGLALGCGYLPSLGGSQVAAQEALILTATPEKSQLLVGEPLTLRLEVSNPSPEPVTGELDLDLYSGLLVTATGSAGSELKVLVTPEAQTGLVDAVGDQITLAPGQTTRGVVTLSYDPSNEDWVFPTPGSYQVQATLSYDPEDLEKIVESNRATINVVAPSGEDQNALRFLESNNLKPYLTPAILDFTGLEQALPGLLQFLDDFPNSVYQPFVLDALDPVASEFSDELLIPPTVRLIASPTTGTPPLTVNFTAATQKKRGRVEEYLWDFDGDGQVDETTTSPSVSHIFSEAGTFPASVLAIDDSNLAASDTIIIATQPGFHLGFVPQGLGLLPGEETEILVSVTAMNRSVSAAELEITFDPQIIQVISLEPGDLLGANPILGVNTVDNSSGVLRLAWGRSGSDNSPSSGALARINLAAAETAPSPSATLLTISSARLVDQRFELAASADFHLLDPAVVAIP